jgi:16S rRNA C967 or C1407 C5-methylase (RsmB/RsmF family)/NOL1/NOP2/fmu family ribosome biogenesis protein
MMFPEAFKNRITTQKYIDAESLLKALQEPSPVSIRINPAKWDKKPLNGEPVPWCKNGYYLPSRPSYTLDPLFHSGCYYPQEASSMFLEHAVNQSAGTLENIRVLDLCGAPGGKSTHLSDLIGTGSLLITNDVIRSRAVILSETITKWGAGNAIVTQNDPAVFGRLTGYFDIILVDAPCSGEGMFRTEVAVSEWSEENTAHCAVRQKRILMDIWPSLKENGLLIYSTCTFNPCENEENIKWLAGKHEAEIVKMDISDLKGITEIDYQGISGYGFHPGKIRGEGFFISVIRKTAKHIGVRTKSQIKPELKPGKIDYEVVERSTLFSKERLIRWGEELISVPCDIDEYTYLFQNLNVVIPGTKLFTVKKNDYLPAHDLALSKHIRKDAFEVAEVELSEAISYMRRDTFPLVSSVKGWTLLTFRGVNLGFVKNLGNRINNYFPVEWRIRMNSSEAGVDSLIKW